MLTGYPVQLHHWNGAASQNNTRHDEHYSERPEFKIHPNCGRGCNQQTLRRCGTECPASQAYLLFTMSMITVRPWPHGTDVSFRITACQRSEWWSQTGSNRRPQACKASALPTELWPRSRSITRFQRARMVGLGRFELPTSRLSSARSNQLSYRPAREAVVIRRKRNEDGGVPRL